MENIGYIDVIRNEYDKMCKDDEIIKSSQETINALTDLARVEGYGTGNNGETSTIAINNVGSIQINEYLTRKNKLLEACVSRSLKSEGIDNLGELIEEIELTNDRERDKVLKFIVTAFPSNLVNIAKNFNKDINTDQSVMTHLYLGNDIFVPVEDVTVKQMQSRLKVALNKTSVVNYDEKIGFDHVEISEINIIRKQIKNVKLRNIYYRLINKDFFNGVKMKKYKMTENDECGRCGEQETIEHLLWECRYSKLAWDSFNTVLANKEIKDSFIKSYKDVYSFNNLACVNTIKLKIINGLIQIERPKNMNVDNIIKIINDLKNIEKYIAKKNQSLKQFEKKWNQFI